MHRIVRRIALLSAMAGATAALTPGLASATPSSGVSATVTSTFAFGGKDYVVRQIIIQPGGSTGWHWHDGTLYAYVEQGTLTHTESTCTKTDVYAKGASFVEPSGADHVHIGRNLSSTPLVLNVLYVDPVGSPLSEDAPNPGCGFQ